MTRIIDVILVLALATATWYVWMMNNKVSELKALNTELLRVTRQDVAQGLPLLPLAGRNLSDRPTRLTPGAPEVVLYLSPRCGVCRNSIPGWLKILHTIGPRNAVVIAPPSATKELRDYLAKHKIRAREAIVLDDKYVFSLGLRAVPRTILVDSHGRAARVWRGALDDRAVQSVVATWLTLS